MGLARTMLTALVLSVWVMIHAVFIANAPAEQGAEERMLPLRIPSVFRMAWFRTLVETHMDTERLKIAEPPQPHASFWSSLTKKGGKLSSPRGVYGGSTYGSRDEEEKPWLRLLSWLITAMTMAEFATFLYFLWATIWRTVLRPVIFVFFLLALLLLLFYCVKGYYFVVAPAFFDGPDPAVLPYLAAVDAFLHKTALSLWAWHETGFQLVDRLLAVLVSPTSVLEEQSMQAKLDKGAGLDAGLAGFIQTAKRTLYALLAGGERLSTHGPHTGQTEL
ncbi:conserved hypothetical protein [Neospora caninum Liverpool]|uniref:Transmembrane protein n=1 Tax=Neospora caninum (strain Liverpool) TaxID=572307 RepID=F0VQP6_NEOCL|nr:conserved hypothetical protein [Neospora caninum Liverpool]CBZ56043.1 conserved hypothetical protein [Neospora caninum Liverpool]CEL70791.1 TPA: hypothetical protein BN1204_064690 [Neospora caninum Liverpool]|eukprot:XP_003886069.1 conserved hypothetical protein [Neospora caninum Liverpool]